MAANDPSDWPGRWRFIVNPVAGAGDCGRRWPGIRALLAGAGVVGDVVLTRHPGDAVPLAAAAAATGEGLVAVGGDGTFSEVASGLLQSGPSTSPLGLVPLGTGSDFARCLGIPRIEAAVEAFQGRCSRGVDVIRVECQGPNGPHTLHALSFAAAGISGELLKRTTPRVKRWFGRRLAYYVGLVRALWHHRAPWLRLQWDGGGQEGTYLFVGISNTEQAGGGMRLAPGAVPDDGQLNVTLVDALGRGETLRQLRLLSTGRHVEHPRVNYFPATELAIHTDSPVEVQADGDNVGWTPASFRVVPGALRVVVPTGMAHAPRAEQSDRLGLPISGAGC
ncbi:MAG: diacylglycerol kinase family lipid kinase [Verrucomicrobiales bacterium]|nr:diacylglycerol kinase family lipid kinase [Verrucomicrobiales bacterium]